MDSVAQFPVAIANDDDDEPEESFFISYERLDNSLVIPPTTEVKICGGECYTYCVVELNHQFTLFEYNILTDT